MLGQGAPLQAGTHHMGGHRCTMESPRLDSWKTHLLSFENALFKILWPVLPDALAEFPKDATIQMFPLSGPLVLGGPWGQARQSLEGHGVVITGWHLNPSGQA